MKIIPCEHCPKLVFCVNKDIIYLEIRCKSFKRYSKNCKVIKRLRKHTLLTTPLLKIRKNLNPYIEAIVIR